MLQQASHLLLNTYFGPNVGYFTCALNASFIGYRPINIYGLGLESQVFGFTSYPALALMLLALLISLKLTSPIQRGKALPRCSVICG
jgi:hypothetical protein